MSDSLNGQKDPVTQQPQNDDKAPRVVVRDTSAFVDRPFGRCGHLTNPDKASLNEWIDGAVVSRHVTDAGEPGVGG